MHPLVTNHKENIESFSPYKNNEKSKNIEIQYYLNMNIILI